MTIVQITPGLTTDSGERMHTNRSLNSHKLPPLHQWSNIPQHVQTSVILKDANQPSLLNKATTEPQK